jgi:hypothetical protein
MSMRFDAGVSAFVVAGAAPPALLSSRSVPRAPQPGAREMSSAAHTLHAKAALRPARDLLITVDRVIMVMGGLLNRR